MTSKGLSPRAGLLLPVPLSLQVPATVAPGLRRRPFYHMHVSLVRSPDRPLLLSLGPSAQKILSVPSKVGSLSPSPVEVLLSNLAALQVRFPGDFCHFARSPGWKTDVGLKNFHSSGRTSLVLLLSSFWITRPAGLGFDFIMIAPLLHVLLWLLLCLWTCAIFSVGSDVLLLLMAVH